MDFRNNLYFQKLWSGCWEEESSVLQESPGWAAMLYLRYKSSMTCLLSCSVWAFTPTTFMACKCRGGGKHQSVRHHRGLVRRDVRGHCPLWGHRLTLSPMLTLVKLRVCRWMLEALMAGAMVSTSSFSRYWPMNGQACWMIYRRNCISALHKWPFGKSEFQNWFFLLYCKSSWPRQKKIKIK